MEFGFSLFFRKWIFYTDHGKPFPDSQTSYYSLFEFLIHLSVNIFDFDKIEAQNQRLLDLRKKAVAEQKRVLRDQRKAVLKEKKERSEAEALKSAVKVSCSTYYWQEIGFFFDEFECSRYLFAG